MLRDILLVRWADLRGKYRSWTSRHGIFPFCF
jgi:hypothetical protein